MRGIDKAYIYSRLSQMKESGVNPKKIDKVFKLVAESDSVPYEAIIFVNRYIEIPQLGTYNNINATKEKNPLYRNLVNEKLPDAEKAIALSSLLTRALISAKMMDPEDKEEFLEIMCVGRICKALYEYSVGSNEELVEVFFAVRDTIKRLYQTKI